MPNMGITRKGPQARTSPTQRIDSSVGSAAAWFSSTQRKVLGLLFGNPGRSFLTTEIIARAGGGSGGVQRELARLTASGLVQVERVGRQAHYRVNVASPVFEELFGLVRKTVGLVDPLRAALAPLQDRIVLALVYGSVARGEAKAESDVDLLVVSDELTSEHLYTALAPVEEQLSRPVQPKLMRSLEFERRKKEEGSFVQRVLGAELEWLIGKPDGDSRAG
jgi:predicted nucleotidyltransferase